MKKVTWLIVLLSLAQMMVIGAWADETALDRYVAKPDLNYGYDRYHTENKPLYRTYFYHMTSQKWRDNCPWCNSATSCF